MIVNVSHRTSTRCGLAIALALVASGCSSSSARPTAGAQIALSASTAATSPDVAAAAPESPSVVQPLSRRGEAALKASREAIYVWNERVLADPPPRGTYVGDTFFVLAGDKGAALDAAVKETQLIVDAMWHGPMRTQLETAVTIWVYSTHRKMAADLHEFVPDARGTEVGLGLYWEPTNEIDFTTEGGGIGTLAHELIHPLLRKGDFPTAPLWLEEGLASLYESFDPPTAAEPYVLRPRAHFRLQQLREALKSPDLASEVRMDTLFGMTDEWFRSNDALGYPCARELLRWLFQRGQLWDFYHRWRDDGVSDPTGRRAFTTTVGMTPEQANDAWKAWLTSAEAVAP